MNQIVQLAKQITRRSSLQTYITIRLLVDHPLVDDAYKAYAYFRWLDDQIDESLTTPNSAVHLCQDSAGLFKPLFKFKAKTKASSA